MVESIYFLKPAWCGTHFAGLWPEQGFQPVTRATALRRWFVTPPDPPPNVPPLKDSSGHADGATPIEVSMRQRMDEHRGNPVCASCHRMFDPIGFALEAFDAVGRYRTTEFGEPLDLSGQLVDGAQFTGPTGLRQALLRYSPQFVQVVTEKLLTYALGRDLKYYDMPAVRGFATKRSGATIGFQHSFWES